MTFGRRVDDGWTTGGSLPDDFWTTGGRPNRALVAIWIRLERALRGNADVIGLFLAELGQADAEFV